MISTLTLRTGLAGLALSIATGCTSIAGPPAPPGAATPVTTEPAQRVPDNAGSRRIHAGAGRT
jgi:hypothetical protein